MHNKQTVTSIIYNQTSAERNNFLRLLTAADAARSKAVVETTQTKRSRSFEQWNAFLHSIGVNEVFLEHFQRDQRVTIMSCFAQAVREGSFSTRNKGQLVEGTVSTTLSHVAQAFRANHREDPRLDMDGKTAYIITEQLKGYKNEDSSKRKQKALPMFVIRKIMELAITDKQIALAWLLVGAIFFAMRSCEYLKTVHKEDSKRTKILRLKNIIFKKNRKTLDHTDEEIVSADLVIIKFEFQKNNIRNKSVHMWSTGDKVLCPVRAWAETVRRIRKTVPDVNEDTKVSEYFFEGMKNEFNSTEARNVIRNTTEVIGEKVLGFNKDDVGLHSLRSGGAMAMFLSGTSEIIIQRVGRWESLAFLEYIREQVETFTYRVSSNMLKCEDYYHINTNEHEENKKDDKGKVKNEIRHRKEDGGTIEIPYTVRYNNELFIEPKLGIEFPLGRTTSK